MFALIGAHSEQRLGGVFNGVGRGVYSARVDVSTGRFEFIDEFEVPDPTFLAVSSIHQVVYAASHSVMFERRPGSGVTALAISPRGHLSLHGFRRLERPHATMISIDREEKFLFVACSFGGGIYAMRLDEDGTVSQDPAFEASFPGDVVVHKGEVLSPAMVPGADAPGMPQPPMTITRMPWYGTSTMPHAIVQSHDRRWIFVPDAGAAKIHTLNFDEGTGAMTKAHSFALNRLAGPRSVVVDSKDQTLYVVNEKESTLGVFRFDHATGVLQELQTISTVPEGWSGANTASGIALASDGRFLWSTNRGHDSITTYRVMSDGTLAWAGTTPSGGRAPWHVSVSSQGNLLCVSNTFSRNVATFKVGSDGIAEPLTVNAVPATCCVLLG